MNRKMTLGVLLAIAISTIAVPDQVALSPASTAHAGGFRYTMKKLGRETKRALKNGTEAIGSTLKHTNPFDRKSNVRKGTRNLIKLVDRANKKASKWMNKNFPEFGGEISLNSNGQITGAITHSSGARAEGVLYDPPRDESPRRPMPKRSAQVSAPKNDKSRQSHDVKNVSAKKKSSAAPSGSDTTKIVGAGEGFKTLEAAGELAKVKEGELSKRTDNARIAERLAEQADRRAQQAVESASSDFSAAKARQAAAQFDVAAQAHTSDSAADFYRFQQAAHEADWLTEDIFAAHRNLDSATAEANKVRSLLQAAQDSVGSVPAANVLSRRVLRGVAAAGNYAGPVGDGVRVYEGYKEYQRAGEKGDSAGQRAAVGGTVGDIGCGTVGFAMGVAIGGRRPHLAIPTGLATSIAMSKICEHFGRQAGRALGTTVPNPMLKK